MPVSENGWEVISSESDPRLTRITINGRAGKRTFTFHKAVAPLFFDLLTWFDKNIEPIQSDSYAYSYRKISGTDTWSNHSSGTSVDINAAAHPFGAKNTFTSSQIQALRSKAASLGMRWGGDYRRPDEMHFEINFKPTQQIPAPSTPAVTPVPSTPYPTEPEPVWSPPPTPAQKPQLPATVPVEKKEGIPWSYIAIASSILTVTTGLLWYAIRRKRGS
jgi:hypothetical protein